jgi:hypothetical protein
VLYGVVREHLETFLASARDTYEAPLPRYVEDERRGFDCRRVRRTRSLTN